ncbi:MAG: type IV pilus twitching motility protein PilT [Rhodothermales bacterium]
MEHSGSIPANPRPPARPLRTPSRSTVSLSEPANDGLPGFVAQIIGSIPAMSYGEERIRFLLDRLGHVDSNDRAQLRIFFNSLVSRMATVGASDMDMGGESSNGHIWFRSDGDKKPGEGLPRLSTDESALVILNLLGATALESLFSWRAADFSHEIPGEPGERRRRFRASAYMEMGNLALNMRSIQDSLFPLNSLGFHPAIERGLMFSHERDGLTLVTGVTGSGKSSTLDAIVDANNADFHGHIVVVGKPIEYMHASKKCIVRHREVGQDVPSFKDGIVQALRQDPDIVVIGEMRDPETISSAIEITDSGHKVFSTLHTSSAVESIDRIVGEYPPNEQDRVRNRLADTLRCIISQKLAPKRGGGRVLAKEVLWVTPSARAAIKNDNSGEIYQMMWEGWGQGQITLEQDLFRLMRQGLITPETAMSYANNKRRFMQLAK